MSYNPNLSFEDLLEKLQDSFGGVFTPDFYRQQPKQEYTAPKTEQKPALKDFTWTGAVPGINPSSVQVLFKGQTIRIHYSVSFSENMEALLKKDNGVLASRLLKDSLELTIYVKNPEDYDIEKAVVLVEAGVLALLIPVKQEEAGIAHTIPVNPKDFNSIC
jgi:hypothetical protein